MTNNEALIALIKRISLHFPILSSIDREVHLDREESPTGQLEASQWCQSFPVKYVIKTFKFEDSASTDHEYIIYTFSPASEWIFIKLFAERKIMVSNSSLGSKK